MAVEQSIGIGYTFQTYYVYSLVDDLMELEKATVEAGLIDSDELSDFNWNFDTEVTSETMMKTPQLINKLNNKIIIIYQHEEYSLSPFSFLLLFHVYLTRLRVF